MTMFRSTTVRMDIVYLTAIKTTFDGADPLA